MPQWVGTVPYSHLVNKSWGYPTDCSGYISWALDAGQDIKAYEWSATQYSTPISPDQLQYGDIITHIWDSSPLHRCSGESEKGAEHTELPSLYLSGHVIFFDRWVDDKQTEYWSYESTETEDQTKDCKAQKEDMAPE